VISPFRSPSPQSYTCSPRISGFYINLPVGALAAIAIVLLRIPEQTPKRPPFAVLSKLHIYIDFVGFVLFAGAILQLLLALQYGGNTYPWNSSQVIGLFCGAGVTLILFLVWNWHKKDGALLPVSLIGRRIVWSGGLFHGSLYSAVYGAVYFLPIYFQAINQASPMMSGVYMLPLIVPQLVMAASSGALRELFSVSIALQTISS
jgi:hypothetical protein